MNSNPLSHPFLIIFILMIFALPSAGCAKQERAEPFIYVDGTRGCKQAPAPVTLWQEAGAAAVGSEAIGEVPHGVKLALVDETSYFGITFYLVEYKGEKGWIPINFTDSLEPFCE